MKKLGVAGIALALMAATAGGAIAASHSGGDKMDSKKPHRGAHMMQKFDIDGDGSLSKAEFEAMQANRPTFEQLDKNGDGVLNKDDRREMRKERREMRKDHKGDKHQPDSEMKN